MSVTPLLKLKANCMKLAIVHFLLNLNFPARLIQSIPNRNYGDVCSVKVYARVSSSNTMVEHWSRHPKVQGLSPATREEQNKLDCADP